MYLIQLQRFENNEKGAARTVMNIVYGSLNRSDKQ